MIRRLAAVAAVSLLLAGSANAQSSPPSAPVATPQAAPAEPMAAPQMLGAGIPASADDCIARANELGRQAEAKPIPEAKLDRLDDLFNKMEQSCDARQFAEAATLAADIKTMLDGN